MNVAVFFASIFHLCVSQSFGKEMSPFSTDMPIRLKEVKDNLSLDVTSSTSSSVKLQTNGQGLLNAVYTPSSLSNISYDSIVSVKNYFSTQSYGRTIELKFLSPNSTYFVCVKRVKPPATECIKTKTKLFTDSVMDLLIKARTDDKLTIAWDPPSGFEIGNLKYGIFYRNKKNFQPYTASRVRSPQNENDFEETGSGYAENTEGSNGASSPKRKRNGETYFLNYTFAWDEERDKDELACVEPVFNNVQIGIPRCIKMTETFMPNLTWENLSTGGSIISWGFVENSTKCLSWKFTYNNGHFCSETHPRFEHKEKNEFSITLDTIKDPTTAVVKCRASERDHLIGKVFHPGVQTLNGSDVMVNVESDAWEEFAEDSQDATHLLFSFKSPSWEYTPLTINLTFNGSSIIYEHFRGCEWHHLVMNLEPYTEYSWSFSAYEEPLQKRYRHIQWHPGQDDGGTIHKAQGTSRTAASECGQPMNATLHLGNIGDSQSSSSELEVWLPQRKTGKVEAVRVQISSPSLIRRHSIKVPCSNELVCKFPLDFDFLPDKDYRIDVSCAHELSTFGKSYSFQEKTEALVPEKGKRGLTVGKLKWYEGGELNSVLVTIHKKGLDRKAGEIRSFHVYYGPSGRRLPLRRGIIDEFNSTHAEFNKLRGFKFLMVDPDEDVFEVKSLSHHTDYDLVLYYTNRKGFSYAKKLSFRTPRNPVIGKVFLLLILIAYVLIIIQVEVVSRKHRVPRSLPWDTFPTCSHPKEEEFRTTILKAEAKNTLKELLQTGNTKIEEGFNKLNDFEANFPMEYGLAEDNFLKNRYSDILPYDYSRVVLHDVTGNPDEDYINASYVHGYKKNLAFIAAQGPTKDTIDDLWRMVWEKNVKYIVMLTKCKEGIEKCSKYWPSNGDVRFTSSGITIQSLSENSDTAAGYSVRNFQVSKTFLSSRLVQQYHFTSWPDKRSPLIPDKLLQMTLELMNSHQKRQSKSHKEPVLVHCSAGIGRTGTFIALWNLIEEYNDSDVTYLDIMCCVFKLRLMRTKMVQTLSQYRFLHDALLCYIEMETEGKSLCTSPNLLTKCYSDLYASEDEGLEPFSDEESEGEEDDKPKEKRKEGRKENREKDKKEQDPSQ